MTDDVLCDLAVSLLPGMNIRKLQQLQEAGIQTRQFLRETPDNISGPALDDASSEIEYCRSQGIRILAYQQEGYPRRLAEIPDAPMVIYVLGNADLDSIHWLSVVGTRRCTAYGAGICRHLTADIAEAGIKATITSGLATGIDTAAHIGALESHLPTIAVLAHGLDMLYPADNRKLAARILHEGGALISEYRRGFHPMKRTFLERNRIVAGLSDATVIVESDVKGGAMSTARLALEYNREVFAFPGRAGDYESRGCNKLIKTQRAALAESAADIVSEMRWEHAPSHKPDALQPTLFAELTDEEKAICSFIREKSVPATIDELYEATGMDVRQLTALLTEMEFDGKISRRAGNRFVLSR